MYKKIYEIDNPFEGKSSAIVVQTKTGPKTVIFEGKGSGVHLTFETSNESIMDGLENSTPFQDGIIKVFQVIGEKDKVVKQVGKDVGKPDSAEQNEYPDVTSWQEAKDILRKDYGIAHQRLGSAERISERAEEVGVKFPNLTV